MTFQDLILKLQSYWAKQGCILAQGYDLEVGAGTMNPATFLRVLGPEPWKVAYVEPSRRPADGRFGDNPNRLFQHHQFQVILKPNPPDTQDLYLGSLRAIGIDPRAHDIRFVEDDWESPTLGAWGLGWEVWCDGMEITQYTYFQQAGGFEVKPVAAELTYGLERIAMYLQDVENVFDVEWVKGVKYREVFHRNEVEMSEYAFRAERPEDALRPVRRLRGGVQAAHRGPAAAAGLRPLPQVLPHLQHARRPRRHQRHRARRLHRPRARAGAPVRHGATWPRGRPSDSPCCRPGSARRRSRQRARPAKRPRPDSRRRAWRTFFSRSAPRRSRRASRRRRCSSWPRTCRRRSTTPASAHGEVRRWGRRGGSPSGRATWQRRQGDAISQALGPPVAQAFDAAGNPTPAAAGFARSQGVEVAALERVETPKGLRLAVTKVEKGRKAEQVVPAILERLVAGLRFKKAMRSRSDEVTFARPVRWMVALLGGRPVTVRHGDVKQRPDHLRPRFLAPRAIPLSGTPEDYVARLRKALRRRRPRRAAGRGGEGARPGRPQGRGQRSVPTSRCVEQVTWLVEHPTGIAGSFEKSNLELPPEVVVSEMRNHQRYFAVSRRARGGSPTASWPSPARR